MSSLKKQAIPSHPAFRDGTLNAFDPCKLTIEGEGKIYECRDYLDAAEVIQAFARVKKNANTFGWVTREDGTCPIGVDAKGQFHGDSGYDDSDESEAIPIGKPTKKSKSKSIKGESVTFRLTPEEHEQLAELIKLAEVQTGIELNKSWAIRECLKVSIPILKKKYK